MSNDIQQRLAFLGIDDATRQTLREAQPVLANALPAVLDRFYDHLGAFPDVARMFAAKAVQDRAKAMQLKHWLLIGAAEFDERYVESVRRVGEAHNRLGLEPRWYIGGYAFVVNGLVSEVSARLKDGAFRNKVHLRNTWLTAITKAAMLDMDLAISVYLDAGRRDKRETLDKLASSFEASVRGAIQEVAASAGQMQQNAQAMAELASEAKAKTTAVSAASLQTAHTSSSVASAAEELSASVSEIRRRVQSSTLVAQTANDMAGGVSGAMGALLEQARAVNQVTEFIDNVASQINLLALNATIEAARAGEVGKGFVVVAAEVKSLANQTTKAVEDISKQLEEMQQASANAEDQVKKITAVIEEINANSTCIAAAIEEQSAATSEIARNVTETSAAAKETTRNIAIVEQGTEQATQSSAEVLLSAEQLSQHAALLRSRVDEFLKSLLAA